MTTFYAIVDLEDLPRLRDEGIVDWQLLEDFDTAVERSWEGETVVVSVEIDDPNAALIVDDLELARVWEQVSNMARPLQEGEEDTGFRNDVTDEPITWDSEWALERAADLYKYIVEDENVPEPTWKDSAEDLGTVVLVREIPPDRVKLLTPVDRSDLEDEDAYREAAEAMEPVALSSLGAAFWVWLILYMSQIFGPEWGKQAEAEEAERKAKKRRARRKPSRKKKAKKRKRRKRKPAELGVAW